MGVELAKTGLDIRHVIEHRGDDVPPALLFPFLARAQVQGSVYRLLTLEGGQKTGQDLARGELTAQAGGHRGVDDRSGRGRVDQRPDGVEPQSTDRRQGVFP